jgi:hypothetical protein
LGEIFKGVRFILGHSEGECSIYDSTFLILASAFRLGIKYGENGRFSDISGGKRLGSRHRARNSSRNVKARDGKRLASAHRANSTGDTRPFEHIKWRSTKSSMDDQSPGDRRGDLNLTIPDEEILRAE